MGLPNTANFFMGLSDFFKSIRKEKRKPTETTPYYRIGGEDKVRILTNRFYDIMRDDPMAQQLYALHPKPLDRIREIFFLYLSMWLGGPDTYQQLYGHPRLRARHMPFNVTPELKEQWMYCMRKAMFETVDDIQLAQQLITALDQLAEHMINSE